MSCICQEWVCCRIWSSIPSSGLSPFSSIFHLNRIPSLNFSKKKQQNDPQTMVFRPILDDSDVPHGLRNPQNQRQQRHGSPATRSWALPAPNAESVSGCCLGGGPCQDPCGKRCAADQKFTLEVKFRWIWPISLLLDMIAQHIYSDVSVKYSIV